MNEVHIEEAIKQPKRYWTSDGIPEIVMGGFWLLWAAAVLLPFLIPNRGGTPFRAGALILAMVAMGFLMPRIIRAWKQRLTDPRTGYVELRKPSVAVRLATIVLAGVTSFAVALAARSGSSFREWMPIAAGMLMAGGFIQAAWRMRSARLAILAPLIAVASLVTTAMRLHVDLSYGVILLASGVVCLADGLMTLRGYLKAHPLPAGEQL